MTTEAIAQRLTELCSKGEFEKAQKELYAPDVVSIEPMATPAFAKEVKGLDAIIEKGHQFENMVAEMHSIKLSEPLVAANSIALSLTMDVTMKDHPRETMTELCLYKVKDGKIVLEEFFM